MKHGFTLVELIVTMAIFIVILMVAAQTFNSIITQSAKLTKSEESNIEGVIGLEVMRHDLEQMGFGLPWGVLPGATITYSEADTANWSADTTNYAKMSDAGATPPIPRALIGFNGFSNFTSDFIGVKASTVGRKAASQHWTYIPYHNYSAGGSVYESRPVSWPANNLQADDKVIAVRSNFNDPDDDRLLVDNGGVFSFDYKSDGTIDSNFLPSDPQGLQMHMLYGIERGVAPRMPFNRADFFVRVPDSTTGGVLPAFCAPGTGVLFKASLKHSDGRYEYTPLLDCIADMQVVLGWSFNAGEAKTLDGVHAYSSLPDKSDYSVTASPASAAADIKTWLQNPKDIREHLKMVKVYILAQEGRKDLGYTYPLASVVVGDQANGEASMTRIYGFSEAQRRYRWKLYRVIVRPKNLVSNQR